MQNQPIESYGFSAEPRVIKPKTKYREVPQEDAQRENRNITNLMYDRRVVRGNTYAAIVTTSREQAQQIRSIMKPQRRIQKRNEPEEVEVMTGEVNTPRALKGRCHVESYTDENVEIITDKPPCYEKDAQTDFVIEKPVPRHYMHQKTGTDVETQIWDDEQLFNFDYEVEPILQVLIGKTLEQGQLEVLEEEELRAMREDQKKYDELLLAEVTEAQRLEAKERKIMEENERKKKEHRIKKESVTKTHQKMVSRAFAKNFLKNLKKNTITTLSDQGLFVSKFQVDLNAEVLPFLLQNAFTSVIQTSDIDSFLLNLVDQVSENAVTLHSKIVRDELERRRIEKEERERVEAATKERRRLRAEERNRREELKRRNNMIEQIKEVLFPKAEVREKIFAQALSDIDSHGKDGGTVGLLGGVIGELWILLSTIEDLKEDPEYDYLKQVIVSQDTVQELVDKLVYELVEGIIEVGIAADTEAKLQAIDESLTFENVFACSDSKKNDIENMFKAQIKSYMLNFLRKNKEKLGLRDNFLDWILTSIVRVVMTPEEQARKIKLISATQNYKLSNTPKIMALLELLPSLEGAAEYVLASKKETKPDKAGKGSKEDPKAQRQGTGKANELAKLTESLATESEELILDAANVDYEDKVTIIGYQNEEFRIFVNHLPASIILRRSLLLQLGETAQDLQPRIFDVLKSVNGRARMVEETWTKSIADNFPILNIDQQ